MAKKLVAKKKTPAIARKKPKIIPPSNKNDFMANAQLVKNTLGMATFGINQGFPNNQSPPWTEQLSKTDTEFLNLRWYLVSNFYQFLCELYAEIGLVQTLVDVPVDDGLRGGIEISSKELKEEQISELLSMMDSNEDLTIAAQTAKWNRLFGGAGIIIMTDEDPSDSFNLNEITEGSTVDFRSADLWEMFFDYQNTEGFLPSQWAPDYQYFNYYGVQVHKSRVMTMRGIQPPSFIRPRMRGWGLSVCETLVRPLNQYLKGSDLSFEVMDEFKIDVYMMKNLANTLMAADGAQKVQERIQTANYLKNYQNSIVMDADDKYEQKQLSFAGLADTAKEIRLQIASEMRMPLTKIFGISAAGFNSGEDDIEVYNGMVESQVRNKIRYPTRRMVEIRCKQLFGFVPKDIEIKFQPLREMSSEQEEKIKDSKFNRLNVAASTGQISNEEYRDAANRGNLFDIKLKDTPPDVRGYEDDTVLEDGEARKSDIDNPGTEQTGNVKLKATSPGSVPKGGRQSDQEDDKKDDGRVKKDPLRRRDYENSIMFDKRSYEADGGDSRFDSRRLPFYENPKDLMLWDMCRARSIDAFGMENRKFTIWLYEKLGGKF